MGGSILVAEQRGLATSTVDFDYLTTRIRQVLLGHTTAMVSKVYRALDEGGMTFISLLDLDSQEYQAFVSACEDAQKIAVEDASFTRRSGLWAQLFQILEADARYSPKSENE